MLSAKEVSVEAEKKIIGSGLIAKAFLANEDLPPNVCIYAAGVSNSGCLDVTEFERERIRLTKALTISSPKDIFVYFSTCSIADPNAQHTAYVLHKIAMEKLVSELPNFMIARLPQVAGNTPNPHTLLNYLYAKISRGEKFPIWKNAVRNIIDIDDAVSIVVQLLKNSKFNNVVVNVANQISFPITDIVATMEQVIGKSAIADIIDKSSSYQIDTSLIDDVITQFDFKFDHDYMLRVIQKYYGQGQKNESKALHCYSCLSKPEHIA